MSDNPKLDKNAKEMLDRKAKAIYFTYIKSINSPKLQVNLPSHIVTNIDKQIGGPKSKYVWIFQ